MHNEGVIPMDKLQEIKNFSCPLKKILILSDLLKSIGIKPNYIKMLKRPLVYNGIAILAWYTRFGTIYVAPYGVKINYYLFLKDFDNFDDYVDSIKKEWNRKINRYK